MSWYPTDFAFVVMGQCETGEIFQYCPTQFYRLDEADQWIAANADQYPESELFVETRDMIRWGYSG